MSGTGFRKRFGWYACLLVAGPPVSFLVASRILQPTSCPDGECDELVGVQALIVGGASFVALVLTIVAVELLRRSTRRRR